MWASASLSTHWLAVANSTRCPAWQPRIASPIARWVLPVPGWAEEDHIPLAGDEVEGGEVGDQVAFQSTSMIQVELFDASGAEKRAARILPRRRGRRVRRPRVVGRPPGIPHGTKIRCGPARQADPPTRAGWAPSTLESDRRSRRPHPGWRFCCRSQRHLSVESGHAQRSVVVGERALFHLGFGGRLHQREPLLPQQLRGLHMGRVGVSDVLCKRFGLIVEPYRLHGRKYCCVNTGRPTESVTPEPSAVAEDLAAGRLAELLEPAQIDALLADAEADRIGIDGPDGLISRMIKAVLERGLEVEMADHLGYDRGDPAGQGSGNSRNGTTPEDGDHQRRAVPNSRCRGTATAATTRGWCRSGNAASGRPVT